MIKPAEALVEETFDRPIFLDVSRLIWRRWSGRLPTGIDRVCLAYTAHYGPRAVAVVQWHRFRLLLNQRASYALFEALLDEASDNRVRLAAILCRALFQTKSQPKGKIYLNVGHIGLNTPDLPSWLERAQLRPIFLVHDLIPITHPQFCRAGEAKRHKRRMANLLRSAVAIITNSRHTLNQLTLFAQGEKLPLPKAQLVAWLGAEAPPPPSPSPSDIQDNGSPYFIMVGTIEARKNHLLLLQIWQKLVATNKDQAPRLILVGQRGWEAQNVFDLLDGDQQLRSKVVELGRCTDVEMAKLIRGAQAVMMPSFAEGYGLPIVEGLRLGCPVIAADLGVFREIAGDVPLYLRPDDPEAWLEAILHYAHDGPDRTRQLEALQRYQPPSWADHFAAVDAWLTRL